MPDEAGNPVKGVEDEWIVVDELPEADPRATGSRESTWDTKLEKVQKEVEPGKAVCIRTYLNANAASAAVTALQRRFGKTPEAYGFTFAARKVKTQAGEKRGLFVVYSPDKVKRGEKAKQEAAYNEWKTEHDEKLRVQAAARTAKKKAESAGAAA